MEEIKAKILEIIKEKLEIREEIRPKDLKRYAKTLVYLKDATKDDNAYVDKIIDRMKELHKPIEFPKDMFFGEKKEDI